MGSGHTDDLSDGRSACFTGFPSAWPLRTTVTPSRPSEVEACSQPTLNPDTSRWDDIVVFDRLTIRSGRPIIKGDVVSLRDPVDSRKMIVKRVVAVAGDVVQTLPPYPDVEVLVPEGHVWVEGDEPFRTLDSNKFGPVPLGLVDAKLSYILWPLHRIGPLKPPEKPVSKMGLPRDSEWRDAMAAFERERKRQARVIPASTESDKDIVS